MKKIAQIVQNNVNKRSYDEYQKEILNSAETDFKITWETEKIIKTGLWIKKKKYACFVVVEDGIHKEKISITGLEIIRSETPLIFKEGLKVVLEMILKNKGDDEISKTVNDYIKKAKKLSPDQLSSNISVNNLDKYIDKNNDFQKGTPMHIKGVANYRKLIEILNIKNEYPPIQEGEKTKVIYVKQNPYNVDSISYKVWPKEFNEFGIVPDYERMIDKFFLTKVKYLLSPEGKEEILNQNKRVVKLFF